MYKLFVRAYGGKFNTCKLFDRAYGGKIYIDLDGVYENTETKQNWINLYDTMLHSLKEEERHMVMNSAYMDMGDIIAQIRHHNGR